MRQSYAGARRTIVLLTIVGCVVGSHGHGPSSSPQSSYSRRRVRSMTSSIQLATYDSCSNSNDSLLGATDAAAICATRGGAIDDDPQRRSRGRYDYDRDDGRLPPREWDSRRGDRREGGPGSRPRGDSRGPDPRRGEGGSRPQMDRDRRQSGRYDGDRASRSRESRDHDGRRDHYDDRHRRDRNPRNYEQSKSDDDSSNESDGKSKKWFTLKKDKKSKPQKDEEQQPSSSFDPPRGTSSSQFPPPPPPPPPPTDSTTTPSSGVQINPAETERTPIHYMFPTAEAAAEERKSDDKIMGDDILSMDDEPDMPFLEVDEEEFADRRARRRRRMDEEDERIRVSARRDAVTLFMSTRRGALKVRVGSMIIGAALGGFIGKSLMNDPVMMSIAIASLMFVTGYLRNDYGELSRALGLAFVFTIQRTSSVRKDYPTLPHIKAMIRQSPRKPFPPVDDGESPWKYEPIYRDDPDFKMTYALLAMAVVGSFCGGNIPIIPAWMGGIAGALVFASMTTGANARGDLGRSMGMRVVGLVQLVLAIQSELRILGKAATVSGLIFDKIMIMDRKHRIKDRIVTISKWGYDKVSRTAEQVKEDMEERPERR